MGRWEPKDRCGKALRAGQMCGRPCGHNGQHYSQKALGVRCVAVRQGWRTPAGVVKRILRTAKDRAKRDGIPFRLTENDIDIPPNCPVCQRELRVGEGKVCDSSPTLDKNVPALGYVRGNVSVICFDCNRRKRDMSWSELRTFAEAGQQAFLQYNEGLANA